MATARSWQELVSQGRTAVRMEANARWELGDLAREVDHRGDKTLAEYAEDIGLAEASLEKYRLVASSWPSAHRHPEIAWSVYRELVGESNRFGLLDRLRKDAARKPGAKRGVVTVDEARRARGKTPTRHAPPPRTPQERAAAVRDMVRSEPEAAKAAAEALQETPSGRDQVWEAAHRRREAQRRDADLRDRSTQEDRALHDRVNTRSAVADANSLIRQARRDVLTAAARLEGRTLNDNDRVVLATSLGDLSTATSWLTDYVNGDDMDQMLDRILAEGR